MEACGSQLSVTDRVVSTSDAVAAHAERGEHVGALLDRNTRCAAKQERCESCSARRPANRRSNDESKSLMRTSLIALGVSVFAGCVHMVPPPPTPGPIQPPLVDRPIPPGQGRVYIDVVDGPTDVRVGHTETVTETLNGDDFEVEQFETEQACRTPCVFDLPLGHKLIAFPVHYWFEDDIQDVVVSTTPSLYRRALGSHRRGGSGQVLGILGVSFGGTSFATGAALLPVGLVDNKSALTTAGAITLGAGAVLTALGIWAIIKNPSVDQPGVSAQYDMPP